jgi:hypothetical protein
MVFAPNHITGLEYIDQFLIVILLSIITCYLINQIFQTRSRLIIGVN